MLRNRRPATMSILAVLAVVLALTLAGSVKAQPPPETVLIDQVLRLGSGVNWSECVTVEDGVLTVIAASPPGRSGETARLLFRPNRQTARPDAYLAMPLDLDEVVASHTVRAGSYCYIVMVTNRYPDPRDPNGPERSHKQVRLKVTHEASY